MVAPESIQRLYGNSGIRQLFEEVAAELIGLVGQATVERTRDAVQINCEPEEIGPVVLVTPEAIEFRLPTVRWLHPGLPVPTSQLWRRITYEFAPPEGLAKLIASSRAARKRQFKTCRYCRNRVPPEHRHGGDVCHGCAEQHLGIVH
jgi:hypothetical protein